MGVFGVLIRNLKHVKGPGYHSFKSVVNRKKKRELQNQHVNSSTWINPRHDNARKPVYTCLYFLQDGSPLVMLSVDFDPMNYSDVSITKHRKA